MKIKFLKYMSFLLCCIFFTTVFANHVLSKDDLNIDTLLLESIPSNVDSEYAEDIFPACEDGKRVCKREGKTLDDYYVTEKTGLYVTCHKNKLKAYGASSDGIGEVLDAEFYCKKKSAGFKFSVRNTLKLQQSSISYAECILGQGVCNSGSSTCQSASALMLCPSQDNETSELCFDLPTKQFVFAQCTTDGNFYYELDTIVKNGAPKCGNDFACADANDLELFKEGSEALCLNIGTKKFSPGACSNQLGQCPEYKIPEGFKEPCTGVNEATCTKTGCVDIHCPDGYDLPEGFKEPCFGANDTTKCEKTECTPICSSLVTPLGFEEPCTGVNYDTCTRTGCTPVSNNPTKCKKDDKPDKYKSENGGCKDIRTGVIWGKGYSPAIWESAKDVCEKSTDSGFDDWRLPTSDELESLFVTGGAVPGQDGFMLGDIDEYIQVAGLGYHWGSEDNDTAARIVSLGNGDVGNRRKTTPEYAICVRDDCSSYDIPEGFEFPCEGVDGSTCTLVGCKAKSCNSYSVPPGYSLPCSGVDESTCTLTGCDQIGCTAYPKDQPPLGACAERHHTVMGYVTADGGCKHEETGLVASKIFSDRIDHQTTEEGKSQSDAVEYCENLDESGYCDWRLPSSKEAVALVNSGLKGWLTGGPFYSGQKIWSADAAESGKHHAYTLDAVGVAIESHRKLSVVCVRGEELVDEGPGCRSVGITCFEDSECCSGKCYGNACRHGNERLSRHGEFCLDDYDCEEGLACNLKGYYCDENITHAFLYPDTFQVSWKKIKDITTGGKLNYEGRIQDIGVYKNNLVLYGGSDFINDLRTPTRGFEYSEDGKDWVRNNFSEGFDSASLVTYRGKAYFCGAKDLGSSCLRSNEDNLTNGFTKVFAAYQKRGHPTSDSDLVSFRSPGQEEKLFRFGGMNNNSVLTSSNLPLWTTAGQLPFNTHDRQVIKFLDPKDDYKEKLLAINVYAQVIKVAISEDGVNWEQVSELSNSRADHIVVFNNKIIFFGSTYDVNIRDENNRVLPISTMFVSKDGGRNWQKLTGIPVLEKRLHYSDIILHNHRLFQVGRTVDNTSVALFTYPNSPILDSNAPDDGGNNGGGGDDPPAGTPPGKCNVESESFKTEQGGCKHLASQIVVGKQVNNLTHANAVSYCDELVEGGYNDWRLGTLGEYRTIVIHNNALPEQAIDYVPPNNSLWHGVWTSTQSLSLATSFHEINWDNGVEMTLGQTSTSQVFCIRDGSQIIAGGACTPHSEGQEFLGACTQESSSFFSTGFGGCKEKTTELVVSKQALGFDSWANAKSYCENLDEGGHCDWKLPDTYELDKVRRLNIHELTGDVNDTGCGKARACDENDNAVCCNGNKPICPEKDDEGNSLHSDETSCNTLVAGYTDPGCCYSTPSGVKCYSHINPSCTSINSKTDLVWSTKYTSGGFEQGNVSKWFNRGSATYRAGEEIGTFCFRDATDLQAQAKFAEGICSGETPQIKYMGCRNYQEEYKDSYGGCEDIDNGLIWAGVSGSRHEYEDAKRVCLTANFNGYCDWRMPTENELKRLAATNGTNVISSTINPRCWFDTDNINSKYGWVDISTGHRALGDSNDENYVVCVRSFKDDDRGQASNGGGCIKESDRFQSELGGCHDKLYGLVYFTGLTDKKQWPLASQSCPSGFGVATKAQAQGTGSLGKGGLNFGGDNAREYVGLFKGPYWLADSVPNFNNSAYIYGVGVPSGQADKGERYQPLCVKNSDQADPSVGPPEVTSIQPPAGNSTTMVTLRGVNLDKVTRITYNEIDATLIRGSGFEQKTTLYTTPGRIDNAHSYAYGNGLSNIKVYYLDERGNERFTVPEGDFLGGIYYHHTPYSFNGMLLFDEVYTNKKIGDSCSFDASCPTLYCDQKCEIESTDCSKLEWSQFDLEDKTYADAEVFCSGNAENNQSNWRLPSSNELAACSRIIETQLLNGKEYWTSTDSATAQTQGNRKYLFVKGEPPYILDRLTIPSQKGVVRCVRLKDGSP